MRPRPWLLASSLFLATALPVGAHTHERFHTPPPDDLGLWLLLAVYAQITVSLAWTWLLGKASLGTIVLTLTLTQSVGDVTVSSGVATSVSVVTTVSLDTVEPSAPAGPILVAAAWLAPPAPVFGVSSVAPLWPRGPPSVC